MFLNIESKLFPISFLSKQLINEFHIASRIRKKYGFSEEFFTISGNVVFANFAQVRKFVSKLNEEREDEEKIKVSVVNAAGLIDEIFHFVIRYYEEKINPNVFDKVKKHLEEKIGEESLRKLIFDFIEKFPPTEVFKGKVTIFDYLNSYAGNRSNYNITLEELILLNFSNINPANEKIIELFDDNYLGDKKLYSKCIKEIDEFFKSQLPIGDEKQDLITFLKGPIKNNPKDHESQLDYIMDNWKVIIKDDFQNRILTSKDLIKEEITFEGNGGGGGPTIVPNYKKKNWTDGVSLGKSGFNYAEDSLEDYDEVEAFTSDIHWMPNVILMAKNVYVWLDQLSKTYQREIKRLDQIPDNELDILARRNINGLWLIGIWERSSASKKIKHIMGNIDAVASAYSLYDYTIAHDLGGEDAYHILNEKAKQRGIRLASDMVPNHTGIFSDWMIYHPDYYIQNHESPFPAYQFNGEDLSDDPNIEIKIEDGYWKKSDAAVVFRRIDKRYNDVRYIYHGNDGTVMPWNDTAQLDMIKHEVREAVIQKIFDVARRFSIIRFDAAMTLAKKHFSRLWYPRPGRGGDIPSRSDHAMSKAHFDRLFPVEFWREVVDRINKEMPHTLLLAEAFWLMEGYFVRTLGMHRVYNSAFMHMLMKEENDKYRELIYNTLEFEPEILKRYVNFMSNPDEETAIHQFGTDDKYFGVLTLMITLPGLPMFAHGQIEGYTEKYGMEYQRAYYNEEPKDWLINRHEKEIFPLTRKRYLFSEVENFWFYDFYDEYGNLNDNVFIYSNTFGNENSLVLYNNKFDHVYGNFQKSTPKLIKINENDKFLKAINISESLNIRGDFGLYYIAKDMVSNLEFIYRGSDIANRGFFLELNGFEHRVLVDFREVYDENGDYHQICDELNGHGIYSIEGSIEDKKLSPIYESYEEIFNEKEIEKCSKWLVNKIDSREDREYSPDYIGQKYSDFLETLQNYFNLKIDGIKLRKSFTDNLFLLHKLNATLNSEYANSENPNHMEYLKTFVFTSETNYRENIIILIIWLTLSSLNDILEDNIELTYYLQERLQTKSVHKIIDRLGKGETETYKINTLIKIILEFDGSLFDRNFDMNKFLNYKSERGVSNYFKSEKVDFVKEIFHDDYVKLFLDVNYYEDVWYYSKEQYAEMVEWILSASILDYFDKNPKQIGKSPKLIKNSYLLLKYLLDSSEKSGYQLKNLQDIILHG